MMFGYLMHSKKFAGWVSTLSVFKNVVANYPDFTCKIYICDSTDLDNLPARQPELKIQARPWGLRETKRFRRFNKVERAFVLLPINGDRFLGVF